MNKPATPPEDLAVTRRNGKRGRRGLSQSVATQATEVTSFLQRCGTEPPNKIFRPLFGAENAGDITHGPMCGTTLHQQAPKTAGLGYVGSEVE